MNNLSSGRNIVTATVLFLVGLLVLAVIAFGVWVHFSQLHESEQILSELSAISQVNQIPPSTKRISDKKEITKPCFSLPGLCNGVGVWIEQRFETSLKNDEILAYYDRSFRDSGWAVAEKPTRPEMSPTSGSYWKPIGQDKECFDVYVSINDAPNQQNRRLYEVSYNKGYLWLPNDCH